MNVPHEGITVPEMDYYGSYGVVLAVAIAGGLLVAVAFTSARLIAPHRPNAGGKSSSYITRRWKASRPSARRSWPRPVPSCGEK